jgi:predicted RNA binding protein YcfA (HicA-like mRNA interferase family)
MPRGLLNWKFSEVADFLKGHQFSLNHTNGSHYYYIGFVDNKMRQVCAPFHGSKSLKPRTMRGIILQSGISKKDWLKE